MKRNGSTIIVRAIAVTTTMLGFQLSTGFWQTNPDAPNERQKKMPKLWIKQRRQPHFHDTSITVHNMVARTQSELEDFFLPLVIHHLQKKKKSGEEEKKRHEHSACNCGDSTLLDFQPSAELKQTAPLLLCCKLHSGIIRLSFVQDPRLPPNACWISVPGFFSHQPWGEIMPLL